MGPLHLSNHMVQNCQTGEQMTHWATKFQFSLFNMSQCIICSPVWYHVIARLQMAHHEQNWNQCSLCLWQDILFLLQWSWMVLTHGSLLKQSCMINNNYYYVPTTNNTDETLTLYNETMLKWNIMSKGTLILTFLIVARGVHNPGKRTTFQHKILCWA